MKIIDISAAVHGGMPIWPTMPPVEVRQIRSFAAGDGVNVTQVISDVHVGTHVDAPLHFIDGGSAVDALSLRALIGDCLVVHLDRDEITARDLDAARIPADTRRILFRTRNSRTERDRRGFDENFVALTPDASQWLVDRGFVLVGVDGASVQRFHDSDPATHVILLRHDIVILEGLDLRFVEPGTYVLVCLPVKISGAEGAPARTILLQGVDGLLGEL